MTENPEQRAQRDRAARRQRAMEEALEAQAAEAARPERPASAPRPTTPARPKPRAGWYKHPTMADTQRYWDGDRWTDHIAPGLPTTAGPPAPAPTYLVVPEKDQSGLITAGILMAIFFPIGGFIAGCVLLSKRPGAGVACMLLSVVCFFVWLDVLTPDAPTYTDLYGP